MPTDSDAGAPAPANLEPWGELHEALKEGDPKRVRALIEAGADVRYKRKCGYDASMARVPK